MGDYMREIESFRKYPLRNRDKIICLVGESGSGKTTIAKALEKEGYNIIHSYTTRPPREPNEWGHTFVTKPPFYKPSLGTIALNPNVIAYQELYGNHYWATVEQYLGEGTSIYIIDPAGAEQVRENVKDAEVVVVYLKADFRKRQERMEVVRGSYQTFLRLQKDAEYFKQIQCDYVVDGNGTVEETLELVKRVIERG